MKHMTIRDSRVMRAVADEWLDLNVQISKQTNVWSRRKDLMAYVAPDAGHGVAAASYDPTSGEIDVNTAQAFGEHVTPEMVGDFTERDTHFEWPKAAGAVLHEAMHAQYTTDDMIFESNKQLDKDANYWFTMMDEPRIEGLGVRQYPENREFLRASSLGIVFKDSDLSGMKVTAAAAQTAILGMGRIDAGVLDPKDLKKVTAKVREIIPADVLKKLRALWREFLELKGQTDLARMFDIAREFAEIVKEQSEENGDPKPEDSQGTLGDLLDAIAGDMLSTEINATEAADDIQSREAAAKRVAAKTTEENDRKQNAVRAKAVFDDHISQVGRPSASRKVNSRPPTDEEIGTANRIAKALKKARYRDRTVTKHALAVPPGRLRTSTAMQGQAIRANGGDVDVTPWHKKKRHVVEDPSLTVGIMCDISGSMRAAMQPIAVSAWAMAHATARINGTSATVYYGTSVFAGSAPGERPKEINIYGATDNAEDFDTGFRVLDGGLNLLHGTGGRLVVICSDGQYYAKGQREACRHWLEECRKNGVAVLWLMYGEFKDIQALCNDTGAMYVHVTGNVTDAAEAIGHACTAVLSSASRY